MPSSYTLSLRLTLQATGENNNTWGAILNSGVFGLVDYAVAGVLSFALSGTKNLTTALGATDEARAAMLDVNSGAGGTINLPPVSKGYFVRNGGAGNVVLQAGGAVNAMFAPGDAGPCFSDGSNTYPIMLSGLPLAAFIATQVTGGSDLPSPIGNLGKVMIVRAVGLPPVELWVPDFIQASDVQGLAQALEDTVAFALTL